MFRKQRQKHTARKQTQEKAGTDGPAGTVKNTPRKELVWKEQMERKKKNMKFTEYL